VVVVVVLVVDGRTVVVVVDGRTVVVVVDGRTVVVVVDGRTVVVVVGGGGGWHAAARSTTVAASAVVHLDRPGGRPEPSPLPRALTGARLGAPAVPAITAPSIVGDRLRRRTDVRQPRTPVHRQREPAD
jgi:hypothetical protein